MPSAVRARLRTTAEILDQELLAAARARAAGGVLRERSGSFVASIKGSVRSSDRSVSGRVYTRDERAKLFEYGGTTPGHDILPTSAMALAFVMGSAQVFAAHVHRPEAHYDARHVIGGAFSDMKGDIEAELRGAVRDGLAEAG